MIGHPTNSLPPERRRERPAPLDRRELGADLVDCATEAGLPPARREGPGLDSAQELCRAPGEQGGCRLVVDGRGTAETDVAPAGSLLVGRRDNDHAVNGRPIA